MTSLEKQTHVRKAPGVPEGRAYTTPSYPGPIDLKLDSNEGAIPSSSILAKLSELSVSALREYPHSSKLEAQLAKRYGVSPDQVIATNGGDDALDRACRAVLAPGRELIVPVPTFEMLSQYAQVTGATIVNVSWHEPKFPTADVCAKINANTAAIAVVSPNNPSGAVISADELTQLSEKAPHALLIVDLAYGEFADVDLMDAVLQLPNALAVRTMSKAWGLAGLRIGYAIGPREIISWMKATTGPYAVSGPAIEVACFSLERDQAEMKSFIARVRTERQELTKLLRSWGAQPLESQANFVTAKFKDAKQIWDSLVNVGIAVRIFEGRPEMQGFLRITCPGDAHAYSRLIKGLQAAREGMPNAF